MFFNYQDLLSVGGALRQTPLALVISLLVHIPQIVLTALAWWLLLPVLLRPKLRSMVVLRWIRESLTALVPAGAIVGQAVAAQRLIRRGVAADVASATATVDMTIEGVMQAVFTLAGLLLLLEVRHESPLAHMVMIGFAVVAAGAASMVVAQRSLPAGRVEAALSGAFSRWLALQPGWLTRFQRRVLQLHAERWSLAQSAICHMIAWAIGAVEVWGIVYLLGHSISLGDGFVVESLTQALRSSAFMIPGALGLQEGAIIAACSLVGVAPNVALVLALVRRARELVVGLPGLLAWRQVRRQNTGGGAFSASSAALFAPEATEKS